MKKQEYLIGIAVVFLSIVFAIAIGFDIVAPYRYMKAEASTASFSADNAFSHILNIARKAHPTGSAENAEVRDYIVGQLSALGLKSEVQREFATGSKTSGNVENIVCTIDGNGENGDTVMLVAHYDSAREYPGATDDAQGVAVLLEVARTLREGAQLHNNVVLLFTDGEELRVLGADAFIKNNPSLVKNIALVLNFDACASGPIILFETSDNNRWLISEFNQSGVKVLTTSFLNDMTRLMGFGRTDFGLSFMPNGLKGLDFASAEGGFIAHSDFDNPNSIDMSTLQQEGVCATGLTLHFGNIDNLLAKSSACKDNAIYIPISGSLQITYPYGCSVIFSIVIMIMILLLVIFGVRRKILSLKDMASGFGYMLFMFIITIVMATLIMMTLKWILPQYPNGFVSYPQPASVIFIGISIIIFSILCVGFSRICKRHDLTGALSGFVLFWGVGIFISIFAIRGFNYMFIWSVLPCVIVLGYYILAKKKPIDKTLWSTALLSVMFIPSIVLFIPLVYITNAFISIDGIYQYVFFIVFPASLALPAIHFLSASKKWVLPTVISAAGIVILLMGMMMLVNIR